jgi:hypothetical protein
LINGVKEENWYLSREPYPTKIQDARTISIFVINIGANFDLH